MLPDQSPPVILPFVATRADALDAAQLIADFGCGASAAAVAKANASRNRGNVVNFCRWRQIGWLIDVLSDVDGEQTRH